MTHAVATDQSRSDAATLAIWGFAVSLATLGTAILWNAGVGINWGVWITCVVVAFFAVLRDRYGSVGAPTMAAGAWAVVLAFGAAITTDGSRIAILILATLVLLALALTTSGELSLDVLRPLVALQAPLAALALVMSGLSTEAGGNVRKARSPAVMSLVRTTVVTVPVVLLLILLLAQADPVFAWLRDALQHVLPNDFIGRTFFFALLFGVTLGAYSSAQHGRPAALDPTRPMGVLLGAPERRVLLLALASIMWLFVYSATASLLKNPAAVSGSGITYAEYAHRGFAELSVAATLVIGAVLVTRRSWITTDSWARRAAGMALVGECGMIAIAFMRIVRYEQAYGYTTLRLYAQAYMIVLACMSCLLLAEIMRRAQSTRFAYHSATAALTLLAACVYFNTDAWIVRENVKRYVMTGSLDTSYLANDLSDDAMPALVASLPRLHEPERSLLSGFLRAREASHHRNRDHRWYAWNYRAMQSARAARELRGNEFR
jgi:two-component system, OmpR family, sensor histidine kinase BaeS